MKNHIKGIVGLWLLAILGTITTNERTSGQEAQPATGKIAINNYGTLLGVQNANGNYILGDGKNEMRGGYVLRYQTGKDRKLIYAVGNQRSVDSFIPQNQQSLIVGKEVTAITKTADGKLEITSSFILDEKEERLVIGRLFKNVSSEEIKLMLAQEYLDPKLSLGTQTQVKSARMYWQRVRDRIRASRLEPMGDCYPVPPQRVFSTCPPCDCPPDPVCPNPDNPCCNIPCPQRERFLPGRIFVRGPVLNPGGPLRGQHILPPKIFLARSRDEIIEWSKTISLGLLSSAPAATSSCLRQAQRNEAQLVIHIKAPELFR